VTDTPLESVLRRDRLVVAGAIVVIAALAWGYVLWLAAGMQMGSMEMQGLRMVPSGAGLMVPAGAPWSGAEFALVLLMWGVMMVGMMTPSVAPMLLLHARIARQSRQQGSPFATTGWFLLGYLLVWLAFSVGATIAQWLLERALLLDASMTSNSRLVGATVLAVAGVYQWTNLKQRCLAHCQSPLTFLQQQGGFRRAVAGAMQLGLRHGVYCLGCCWLLMLLLFVLGVMNLLWIAAITIAVLLEKLAPPRWQLPRLTGLCLIVAALALAVPAWH
jgi:predicted metal-binding membrane protein